MKKKNLVIISCVALALVSLTTATYAYLRTGVMGDISASTGNINLVVNNANANLNEKFNIVLKRSDTEEFVIPGDSGYFDININATGSVDSVDATVTLDRTGLPDNLKFYVDENFTEEYTSKMYTIKKADTMVKTVKVYWYWKDIDDENDSLFIGKTITANISITATIHTPTFSETLLAGSYSLDTNVDFSKGASSTNGQGLMMMSSTQYDEYPIMYYRGDVNNNNLIYAGYCWLIVRTTETGGIKIVYNGEVNEDGSCNNYSNVTATKEYDSTYSNAYLNKQTYAFNTSSNSPVYVGYMYNDTNKYYSSSALDASGYRTHLADNTVDSETGRHTQNLKDSTIKSVIDAWYASNIAIKAEESLLEDTVWCNDRSITDATYTPENYASNSNKFYYSAYTRLAKSSGVTPSLTCDRDMDKFTVDSANGNGDLTHPIGMLTADEIVMSGITWSNKTTPNYLSIPSHYFRALSPYAFNNGGANAFIVSRGELYSSFVNNADGVRPAVSLGLGAHITGGNGSFETPYLVG